MSSVGLKVCPVRTMILSASSDWALQKLAATATDTKLQSKHNHNLEDEK